MDTWIASTLAIMIMLLWTFMCKFWYRHMFFIHGSKFTHNFKDIGSQKVQMKRREIWNCTHCCCCAVLYSVVSDCDLMDCSPPASSAHGIFQARILEWVAISYSGGSSQPRDWTCISLSPALAGRFLTTSHLPGNPHDPVCFINSVLRLLQENIYYLRIQVNYKI